MLFPEKPLIMLTRKAFLEDRQGRTFSDVVNDCELPFDVILDFFNDPNRQRRMEESEIHHDRPALAGVVRELESLPDVDRFLSDLHAGRTKRLRQAVGLIVRMIMEKRGWKKTGRKGSLGVRATQSSAKPNHNTGGLAFWFLRAERYELIDGMPFQSVRARLQSLDTRYQKDSKPKASQRRDSTDPARRRNGNSSYRR
jgi:hypothetical protein